jgi:hypothetical protein
MHDLAAFGNYTTAFTAITWVACCGAFLSAAEYFAIRRQFRPDGIYSWKVLSSKREHVAHAGLLNWLDFLFDYRGFTLLNIMRALSCISTLFLMNAGLKWVAAPLWFLAASAAVISYRNIVGCDGSDQMSLLIFTALAIAASSDDWFVKNASLVFIAGQSILSYASAGIAKALSAKWRNGVALQQIMNTRTYGMLSVARWLESQPRWLHIGLCWGTIIVEITFLLVPFLPLPWAVMILVWGAGFHIANAIVMGLNNFFWSFTATYPAIIYLNHLMRQG